MFQGKAEKAINFYLSLFPDAMILDLTRYSKNEPGVEGSVHKASFSIANQVVMCIDSPVKHEFDFTPAFSFFVECESEDEFGRLYSELAGTVLMPIGDYGFSRQFAWINDRFGVSWQLNLRGRADRPSQLSNTCVQETTVLPVAGVSREVVNADTGFSVRRINN
jgi:predicted 3-demethylubiquinone-9 3-methyltransferase (glyoxalase superfamily)